MGVLKHPEHPSGYALAGDSPSSSEFISVSGGVRPSPIRSRLPMSYSLSGSRESPLLSSRKPTQEHHTLKNVYSSTLYSAIHIHVIPPRPTTLTHYPASIQGTQWSTSRQLSTQNTHTHTHLACCQSRLSSLPSWRPPQWRGR